MGGRQRSASPTTTHAKITNSGRGGEEEGRRHCAAGGLPPAAGPSGAPFNSFITPSLSMRLLMGTRCRLRTGGNNGSGEGDGGPRIASHSRSVPAKLIV